MSHPKVSYKRAKALSSSLFLISFAALLFSGHWWPGIMLVIGFPVALRQFLLGRHYDACLSLVIFVGSYLVAGFDIPWDVLLPVLFILSAIYILVTEFCNPFDTKESEDEESLNHEITEDK